MRRQTLISSMVLAIQTGKEPLHSRESQKQNGLKMKYPASKNTVNDELRGQKRPATHQLFNLIYIP